MGRSARPGSSGSVHCPALGGRLEGQDGSFNLFVRAPDARRRRVLYRLFLRDRAGRPLTFSGFKLIEDDPNHDPWRDCSRLLVRLLAGHVSHLAEEDDDPRTVATGVLRISPLRFLRTTLGMRGGPGRRLSAPVLYQAAFVRRLLSVYGGPVLPETQFAFPTVTPGRTPLQGRIGRGMARAARTAGARAAHPALRSGRRPRDQPPPHTRARQRSGEVRTASP